MIGEGTGLFRWFDRKIYEDSPVHPGSLSPNGHFENEDSPEDFILNRT